MRAIYLIKKQVFEEREIPIPKPKPHEVLIKVKSIGVCGSDVHYWEYGKIGDFIVKEPLILGHEVSGEIVEKGGNVSKFKKGDLVVIEPFEVCGICEACRKGRYNLCPHHTFYATPPYDGALREYVAFDSSFVYKVPDGMNAETASLVEPMSAAVFSTKKVNVSLGDKVIIYGSGIIGLCCMVAANTAGASEIVMVDIREERLEFAKNIGATDIINFKENSEIYNCYFDVAFECSGVPTCLIDASDKLKWGGKIAAIGLNTNNTQEAPITSMILREQQLFTTFRYANVYPISLDILNKNIEKIKGFITHKFSLDNVKEAFETARDNRSALKVVINL